MATRRLWRFGLGLLTLAVALPASAGFLQSATPGEQASRKDWIVGVTVDRIDQLPATVESLRSLRRKPTARVVFDEKVPPSEYREAVASIHQVSFVLGEILDSQFVKECSIEDYGKRTKEYLDALESTVDLWEIGNEINGDWLGPPKEVVPKMVAAYDLVKERKKPAVLTLYYNEGSVENRAYEMFRWAQDQIPDRMRQGLDVVLVSFYDDDFEGPAPDWPRVFERLGKLFPAAKLGFGECGTKKAEKKAEFVRRYYGLNVDHPRFVGGYFWWYFSTDMVPSTKPLWNVLNDSLRTP